MKQKESTPKRKKELKKGVSNKVEEYTKLEQKG